LGLAQYPGYHLQATVTLDVLLLEEPENHLSPVHMKKLIERIRASKRKQLFIATHSSFIATRLNLKKVLILSEEKPTEPATLKDLSKDNLRRKIIERFGYFPANIALYTYFKFLHGFCYRPFLRSKKNTKGLTFQPPPSLPRYPLTNDRRFISPGCRLYSNRLAKFIEQAATIASKCFILMMILLIR
jgi:hypothetical protein